MLAVSLTATPQLEQELERVREAHRLLEESNRRRKKLEQAMRSRLENELVKLRGI